MNMFHATLRIVAHRLTGPFRSLAILTRACSPFEDGVTSLVTFDAGQLGDTPMPGVAEISLFFMGFPLGSSNEPVCPPSDPEPCPWQPGDIEASFELPINFGIGGNFRVVYDMSDGNGDPMFCVDLDFSL
jgi:hypothetical protein